MATKIKNFKVETMVEPGEETSGKSEHVNGNELVLFSYHHCVYSQKVR